MRKKVLTTLLAVAMLLSIVPAAALEFMAEMARPLSVASAQEEKLKTVLYEPFQVKNLKDSYYTERFAYAQGGKDPFSTTEEDGGIRLVWSEKRAFGTKATYQNYRAMVECRALGYPNSTQAVVIRYPSIDGMIFEACGNYVGDKGIYIDFKNTDNITLGIHKADKNSELVNVPVNNVFKNAFHQLFISDFNNVIELSIDKNAPFAKIILDNNAKTAQVYDGKNTLLRTVSNTNIPDVGIVAATCRANVDFVVKSMGVMQQDDSGNTLEEGVPYKVLVTNEEFAGKEDGKSYVALEKGKSYPLTGGVKVNFTDDTVAVSPTVTLTDVEPNGAFTLQSGVLTAGPEGGTAKLNITYDGMSTHYDITSMPIPIEVLSIQGRIGDNKITVFDEIPIDTPITIEPICRLNDGSEGIATDYFTLNFRTGVYSTGSGGHNGYVEGVYPAGSLVLDGNELIGKMKDGRAVLQCKVGDSAVETVVTTQEDMFASMRENLVASKVVVSGNKEKDTEPESKYYFDLSLEEYQNISATASEAGEKAMELLKPLETMEDLPKDTSIYKDGFLPNYMPDGKNPLIQAFYERMVPIAAAYITPGTKGYQNKTYYDRLTKALTWLRKYWYNKDTGDQGNNWYQAHIGAGMFLTDIMIYMHDYYTPDERSYFLDARRQYGPDTFGGSNKVWQGMNELAEGLADNNSSIIEKGITAVAQETKYASYKGTPGSTEVKGYDDGFYTDGSYVGHGSFPYTHAGYGRGDMDSKLQFLGTVAGTKYDVSDTIKKMITDILYNNFATTTYKGVALHQMMGRGVTVGSFGTGSAASTMTHMLQWAQIVTGSSEQERAYAIAKGFMMEMSDSYSPGNAVKLIYNTIKNDDSIVPIHETEYMKNMYVTDMAVQRRPNYLASVGMYSKTMKNYESINMQNKKGYFMNAASLRIYDSDTDKFGDWQFITIDPSRMPGITVMPDKAVANIQDGVNKSSFVGSLAFQGKYGAAAMDFTQIASVSGGTTNYTSLNAKKSYFLFDDEIVAVGSGISASEDSMVETVVENQKVSNDARFVIGKDGGETVTTGLEEKKAAVNPNYAFLQGMAAEGSDTGYYFPNPVTIQTKREEREGEWNEYDGSYHGKQKRTYETMVIEHGTNPKDETYAYAILPATTEEKTKQYAANPDIELMKQTPQVHSVKETKLGITGSHFFAAGSDGVISVNKPSLAMYKLTSGTLEISLCDPDKFSGNQSITVTLPNVIIKSATAKDSKVTFTEGSSTQPATITFQTYGLMGDTLSGSFVIEYTNVDHPVTIHKANPSLQIGDNVVTVIPDETYAGENYQVVLSLYYDGQLLDTKLVSNLELDREKDFTFAIPNDDTDLSRYRIVGMVWDNFGSMKPLADPVVFKNL